jgi:hypothetical protein
MVDLKKRDDSFASHGPFFWMLAWCGACVLVMISLEIYAWASRPSHRYEPLDTPQGDLVIEPDMDTHIGSRTNDAVMLYSGPITNSETDKDYPDGTPGHWIQETLRKNTPKGCESRGLEFVGNTQICVHFWCPPETGDSRSSYCWYL